MRKLLTVLMLVMLGSAAMAQNNNMGSSANRTSGVPEAPVGHRQPRADQVPNEKNLSNPNDAVNREDAALDKKIKSICRGC